jgi:hypothetical protein
VVFLDHFFRVLNPLRFLCESQRFKSIDDCNLSWIAVCFLRLVPFQLLISWRYIGLLFLTPSTVVFARAAGRCHL